MITREQIAQLLKSISEAHYQIHSYGWGDVPDLLAREDVIYPFLMVTPSSSNYEEGYATHTYTISIADRVLKDKVNEVNVDSDTHQILLDILSQIDNLMYDDVDVVKGGTITPFFDNFRHQVTGHFADVGIRVKFAYDSCAVPSDIVPLPPSFECADASYRVQYVNGTLIEEGTIASGGSKTINVPNPSTCDDASYQVLDADGNVLYSGTIASGGSENIVVTNSTVVVRKSDNTIISSVSVLAQGSANYQVADNVVSNSDASYTTNVKATDPLTLPDQQINVNSVDEGDIASVGTIDINITDGVNPVTPNSVGIVGRTVTVEVPSGGAASGVALQFPTPSQYTSYANFDEGWRVQNGWYDYTPPTQPAAIAELDYTSANQWYLLKNNLIVNGVSSKTRFVDLNGVQTWGATNNVNAAFVDKLTGLMCTRLVGAAQWAASVINAESYSITINGVVYNDWYLMSLREAISVFGTFLRPNWTDPITSGVIWSRTQVLSYLATTHPNSTGNAFRLFGGTNGNHYDTPGKNAGGADMTVYVRKAFNLITAP